MTGKTFEKKRRYIKSSSFVMAATFTVLCGLAALCLGFFINFFATGHFVQSTEAVLNSQIELVQTRDQVQEGTDKEYLYRFLDAQGQMPELARDKIESFAEGIIVFDYPQNNRQYAAKIHTYEDGRKLLVGFDITAMARDFKFMQLIGVLSIVFVLIVVCISYVISIFVVSGTNTVASTAHSIIKTGDLSRRIDFSSRWDDLGNMTAVLNELLSRVEESMIGIRRVSDNIAHDLRTPLTRMRNKIEMLQDKYNDEDHAALLEEADHLLRTFTALLRITRIETEKQRSHFKALSLDALLRDVIAFYEPLCEDKNISMNVNLAGADILGDKDLLFQAYANILDNAIKYTPENGAVTVTLETIGGDVSVVIEDTGDGVHDDEVDKLFDRFYRGEQSRSSQGTGLGLSLVKAVVELHQGTVEAENMPGGLRIITIF